MYFEKDCPYCKVTNEIETENWERVQCPSCKGVYYAEVYHEIDVRPLPNNGKDDDPTQEV